MLRSYNNPLSWVVAVLAVLVSACSSPPPEDDLPAPKRLVAASHSSASVVSASSSRSASSPASVSPAAVSSSSAASSKPVVQTAPMATAKASGTGKAQLAQAPSGMAAAPIPPDAQAKFSKAMNLVYAGKVDDGALALEQLAAAYPTLAVPYINEGLLYLKANQFEAAERALQRAVERDPQSVVANTYLGVAQRNVGKIKDAEKSYLAALSIDDSYALAHLNLGVLYDLYMQKPEAALPHYERYLDLTPNPESKVASWVKEIRTRLGLNKKPAATADHSGDASSASVEAAK